MTSASFGILNKSLSKDHKFKRNKWTHQVEKYEVDAITTFEPEIKLKKYHIIHGVVSDFIQTFHKVRRLDNKNNPYIFKSIDKTPIQIPFMIINKTYVQTERHTDMRILLQNLNLTVPSNISFHYVSMNLQKINADYPNQWYADTNPNRPHFSRGKLYGNDIVKDELVGGKNFKDFTKTDIGIHENMSDNPVKIRITNHGFFQIPMYESSDYQPTQIEIMELFMNTMQFYANIGKVAPKPKPK